MNKLVPQWIWAKEDIGINSYAEFVFDYETGGELVFKVAVDSDYALFVDGNFINSGAYRYYPDTYVIDQFSMNLQPGNHHFKIVVYYDGGSDNMFYKKGEPGLYFSLEKNGATLVCSNEEILSKKSDKYISNHNERITLQLGYKQKYDFTKEEKPFFNSVIVNKKYDLIDRPNKKCLLLGRSKSSLIKQENNRYLFDLGEEAVGYLDFDILSEETQNITISFGEHIKDGWVRRLIDGRDFSFDFIFQKGKNCLISPLRRIGARYLDIQSEKPLKIEYLGLYKIEYPFVEKPYKFDNPLDEQIYKTAIHTLKCCYHEHFEDCPWREQGLYTLDSRHESLASYYAFNNPEAILSSISLINNDYMHNGQLSICFPCDLDLVIPSFSLHYFTLVWENYKSTNNLQVLKDASEKMDVIIDAFENNMECGLVKDFIGKNYWNFYEWKDGYDGNSGVPIKTDIIINLLFLNALSIKNQINQLLGISISFLPQIENLINRINEEFFDEEKELYYFSKDLKKYSVLINSLCLLFDVVPLKYQKAILQKIMNDNALDQPTLSMKAFYYDALIKFKPDIKDFIIEDIRHTYKKMLDDGATSFYETELGEKDFHGAGSLCHGWSAVIIYYYNLFGLNKAQPNP